MLSFILKLFSAVKTSYLPAFLLFAVAMICVTAQDSLQIKAPFLNTFFYVLTFMNAAFFLIKKDKKDLLFSVFLFLLYVTLNFLRKISPQMPQKNVLDDIVLLLVPLYLGFIFFIKSERISFYHLVLMLLPPMLIENMPVTVFEGFEPFFGVSIIVCWLLCFIFCLARLSAFPSFKQSGLFFAIICVFFGVIFFDDAKNFAIYFAAASGIFLISSIYQAIYEYYIDPISKVASPHLFERDELKKFPPKYSISFFYIDNYAKLLKVFGSHQTDLFVKMILIKLQSLEPDAEIYRLSRSEFCLVFFNSDVRQTYEMMENIRRLIASTEFVSLKKKAIKLTITPVVSEKRRSDANAKAVLLRMHENFRQKYKFTQNMTFCEEMEIGKKTRRSSRFA